MKRHESESLLLLTVFALFIGCASNKPKPTPTLEEQSEADLDYYHAQIREVVKDRERAEKLAGLATDFQKLLLARARAVQQYNASVSVLDANYSATRVEYEKLAAQNQHDNQQFMQQAIALRAQMAALVSDEEWKQLKDARLRGLEDALGSRL